MEQQRRGANPDYPIGNGAKSTAVALPDVIMPAAAIARGVEPHQWSALKNTIWKGASDAMMLVAIDYCKALRLDPIKRPIHIVKTWDQEAGKMIDTIWPGIGSHRITAARTAAYAGQDEPVFGPDETRKLGAGDFTFPLWCKVTVHRLVQGQRVAFTGLVFWLEAAALKKDGAPNAMWRKRPRGQLAKCAEAEALRKAFPEEMGDTATAEEMEDQAIGPDRARDITPAAERPASRLEALESVIEEDEPHDPVTGEILEPDSHVGAEFGLPPVDRSADMGLIAQATHIDTTMMGFDDAAALKAWWSGLDLADMKANGKDLYGDLVRKINERLKSIKK